MLLVLLAANGLASLSLISCLWSRVWFLHHRTYAPSGHSIGDKNTFGRGQLHVMWNELYVVVDFTCSATTSRFSKESRYDFRSTTVKSGSRREAKTFAQLRSDNFAALITTFFALPMIAESFCMVLVGMVFAFL